VVYRLNVGSSKIRGVSAKLSMRWSKPVVIVKDVRPNVVFLANPETGVVVRRAHVTQLKPYVGFFALGARTAAKAGALTCLIPLSPPLRVE
jgi:hypothetical protein